MRRFASCLTVYVLRELVRPHWENNTRLSAAAIGIDECSSVVARSMRFKLSEDSADVLDYATKYPKPGAWHDIGNDPADRKAVGRLKAEGLVEIFEASNLTP